MGYWNEFFFRLIMKSVIHSIYCVKRKKKEENIVTVSIGHFNIMRQRLIKPSVTNYTRPVVWPTPYACAQPWQVSGDRG